MYDGGGEFRSRALSAQIFREYFSVIQHAVQRLPDLLAVTFEIHMIQQLHGTQKHRGWICDIFAHCLRIRVPCTLLRNVNFNYIFKYIF